MSRAVIHPPPSGFSPSPRGDNTMGCSQSIIDKAKSYVVKAETTVDDLPDILQKLMSAKQNDASKAALHMLMEVADSELCRDRGEVGRKIIPKLHAWVGSATPTSSAPRSRAAPC